MAYATTNPPQLVLNFGVGSGARLWYYSSADAAATVRVSGYFTDGYSLGMRDGDQCIVYNTTSKITTWHVVINTSGTTIDLSDASTIGSSTNSD